jgi:hypothetical protein
MGSRADERAPQAPSKRGSLPPKRSRAVTTRKRGAISSCHTTTASRASAEPKTAPPQLPCTHDALQKTVEALLRWYSPERLLNPTGQQNSEELSLSDDDVWALDDAALFEALIPENLRPSVSGGSRRSAGVYESDLIAVLRAAPPSCPPSGARTAMEGRT